MSFENPFENIHPEKKKVEGEKNQEENIIDKAHLENDGRRWIKLVESESKSAVKQYYENLGLTDKMLSKKERILDIGSGMADFAAHCKENKINESVISLEPELEKHPGIDAAQKMYLGAELYDDIKRKTVSGKMEALPFKNDSFDLIVAHAAMPGFNYSAERVEEMQKGVDDSFDEIVRILKSGGEARLFPLEDRSDDKNDLRWPSWRKAIDEKLAQLKKSGNCKILTENVFDPKTKEVKKEKRVIIEKI